MQINWRQYLPTVKDLAERGIKTFAGGFIVGSNLGGVAFNAIAGSPTEAATDINWDQGLNVGLGTLAVSILFSLASIKLGNAGTASVTKAVELAPRAE